MFGQWFRNNKIDQKESDSETEYYDTASDPDSSKPSKFYLLQSSKNEDI